MSPTSLVVDPGFEVRSIWSKNPYSCVLHCFFKIKFTFLPYLGLHCSRGKNGQKRCPQMGDWHRPMIKTWASESEGALPVMNSRTCTDPSKPQFSHLEKGIVSASSGCGRDWRRQHRGRHHEPSLWTILSSS